MLRRLATVALVVALGSAPVAAPIVAQPAAAGRPATPVVASLPPEVLELLPLQTSADRRIVDSAGRDVLLRGANVNSLAEYWQGVPTIDTTIPLDDADWDAMAARGFSVIRLLITWSRIEPTRGVVDQAYLDQVEAYVDAAAEHGIYSVIDMHQDAYTPFISTIDPASCPAGTSPAKGWDGAPAWAVITDGLSTCLLTGDRNSSPAVTRAWDHFYDDTDGIRTSFAQMWGAVAERFAGRPEVAGYDLLNEPETSRPAAELEPLYLDLVADTITEIRAAEAAAGATFEHIVFVEPTVPAGKLSNGIVIPDPAKAGVEVTNVSASVHNYSESIGGGSIEGLNDAIEGITADLGVPNWGGEYGFWDVEPATLEKARRYAADEDDHRWGGAWWQWRQSCGDPHAVFWQGGTVVAPDGDSIHLNRLGCPGNVELGETTEFLDILGRGYPRATPGRLVELRSDPATGHLSITATAGAGDVGETIVVWSPTADDADHPVAVRGLSGLRSIPVDGGRYLVAEVAAVGEYRLWVGPVDQEPVEPTDPTEPRPAEPVPSDAAYTG